MFETLGLVLMGFVLGTFVYFALNGLLEAICYAFDRFASFVAAIPRIIVASIEHIVVAPMFSIIAWIASMLRLLQDASSVALMEGLSWFVVLFILFVSISMLCIWARELYTFASQPKTLTGAAIDQTRDDPPSPTSDYDSGYASEGSDQVTEVTNRPYGPQPSLQNNNGYMVQTVNNSSTLMLQSMKFEDLQKWQQDHIEAVNNPGVPVSTLPDSHPDSRSPPTSAEVTSRSKQFQQPTINAARRQRIEAEKKAMEDTLKARRNQSITFVRQPIKARVRNKMPQAIPQTVAKALQEEPMPKVVAVEVPTTTEEIEESKSGMEDSMLEVVESEERKSSEITQKDVQEVADEFVVENDDIRAGDASSAFVVEADEVARVHEIDGCLNNEAEIDCILAESPSRTSEKYTITELPLMPSAWDEPKAETSTSLGPCNVVDAVKGPQFETRGVSITQSRCHQDAVAPSEKETSDQEVPPIRTDLVPSTPQSPVSLDKIQAHEVVLPEPLEPREPIIEPTSNDTAQEQNKQVTLISVSALLQENARKRAEELAVYETIGTEAHTFRAPAPKCSGDSTKSGPIILASPPTHDTCDDMDVDESVVAHPITPDSVDILPSHEGYTSMEGILMETPAPDVGLNARYSDVMEGVKSTPTHFHSFEAMEDVRDAPTSTLYPTFTVPLTCQQAKQLIIGGRLAADSRAAAHVSGLSVPTEAEIMEAMDTTAGLDDDSDDDYLNDPTPTQEKALGDTGSKNPAVSSTDEQRANVLFNAMSDASQLAAQQESNDVASSSFDSASRATLVIPRTAAAMEIEAMKRNTTARRENQAASADAAKSGTKRSNDFVDATEQSSASRVRAEEDMIAGDLLPLSVNEDARQRQAKTVQQELDAIRERNKQIVASVSAAPRTFATGAKRSSDTSFERPDAFRIRINGGLESLALSALNAADGVVSSQVASKNGQAANVTLQVRGTSQAKVVHDPSADILQTSPTSHHQRPVDEVVPALNPKYFKDIRRVVSRLHEYMTSQVSSPVQQAHVQAVAQWIETRWDVLSRVEDLEAFWTSYPHDSAMIMDVCETMLSSARVFWSARQFLRNESHAKSAFMFWKLFTTSKEGEKISEQYEDMLYSWTLKPKTWDKHDQLVENMENTMGWMRHYLEDFLADDLPQLHCMNCFLPWHGGNLDVNHTEQIGVKLFNFFVRPYLEHRPKWNEKLAKANDEVAEYMKKIGNWVQYERLGRWMKDEGVYKRWENPELYRDVMDGAELSEEEEVDGDSEDEEDYYDEEMGY